MFNEMKCLYFSSLLVDFNIFVNQMIEYLTAVLCFLFISHKVDSEDTERHSDLPVHLWLELK